MKGRGFEGNCVASAKHGKFSLFLLIMSPIYYNWIWNHKVKILLISLVQFVYLRLVELTRWSCKVTRFLMFWYLSKISLHLEMLFSSCSSTKGLASTCLAGQEFPPTIALKKSINLKKVLSAFKRQKECEMESLFCFLPVTWYWQYYVF